MKHTLLLALMAIVPTFACGDADLCVDGVYEDTLVLEPEGYVFAEPPSMFSPGSREVIPYSARPFASCRVIGGMFVQREGAIVDSWHYPELEELGAIVVQDPDEGGPERIDELGGFESVVRFGGIRRASNQEGGLAQIDVISGLNNVERLEGPLKAQADVTGLQSLEHIDGDLRVRVMRNSALLEVVGGNASFGSTYEAVELPALREVGGNLLLDGTRATTLGFPLLMRVGGTVEIDGNSVLESWGGLAPGSRIEGDFIASFNQPVRDEDFEAWLDSSVTSIDGTIRICANASQGLRNCNVADTR